MTDMDQVLYENPARAYEVLGRIMHALRESQALNGAHSLDWWAGDGGRSWEIEWQAGPYAFEAAEQLLSGTPEESIAFAVPGAIRPGDRAANQDRALLYVLDMPVTLRALTPVGASQWLQNLQQTLHAERA